MALVTMNRLKNYVFRIVCILSILTQPSIKGNMPKKKDYLADLRAICYGETAKNDRQQQF
jgi:hypothetical protein